ncbi:MAG: class I SAM-dependent methyltransferase [Acidimicrobiia bacterium]
MLTVDFDRLGLERGHRLLDLGCGAGRHAFESLRRGATVVALDLDLEELSRVRATAGAMLEAGEVPRDTLDAAVRGDALNLPFPDAAFDRIIASEVLEHLWSDTVAMRELVRVLRPGGRLAATVPAARPERICWALDTAYYDTPGGHIRIFEVQELFDKLADAGMTVAGSHRVHALHSPYWWIKCAHGVDNTGAFLVRRYHDFLVWELTNQPRWTRVVERTLSPLFGKSLVVYANKPGGAVPTTPEATRAAA